MIFTAFRLARSPIITCTTDGFAVETAARIDLVAGFDEIERIEIYKRDELTTDLVCFEIVLANGETYTLHEEMPGFDSWVTGLERLPGFAADWREEVILPPFASNHLVAYVRPAPPETP